mmetsp:Transcript_17986/g.42008  ORF Transcript_17986/g.42008 Transcript_17986/m.42008 type:complete len:289 (-) Transcript_17986:27-893(-)
MTSKFLQSMWKPLQQSDLSRALLRNGIPTSLPRSSSHTVQSAGFVGRLRDLKAPGDSAGLPLSLAISALSAVMCVNCWNQRLAQAEEPAVTVPAVDDAKLSELAAPWHHRMVGMKSIKSHIDKWEESLHARPDRQLIWQTCRGPGRIEEIEVYVGQRDPGTVELPEDVLPGKTRMAVVVRTGSELNGHTHIHHGGFTAAMLDDFTGLITATERMPLGMESAMILTANLNINYRRKLPDRSRYLIELEVDRVERHKKVFLKATILNENQEPCVDATALYILKPAVPSSA